MKSWFFINTDKGMQLKQGIRSDYNGALIPQIKKACYDES